MRYLRRLTHQWNKIEYFGVLNSFGCHITSAMQARRKLFEKGGADFEPGPYAVIIYRSTASLESCASPEKADWGGGGVCSQQQKNSFLKILGQFSRHGVGVSLFITNLYNKPPKKFSLPKGGCSRTHRTPPPFRRGWMLALGFGMSSPGKNVKC